MSLSPLQGPDFSSYDGADVLWLLSDVSGRVLETTGVERERSIQLGGHYSESLPVEFRPDEAYHDLYTTALRARASDVASWVATAAEQLLSDRATPPVLVSLARAGTPVGILLKRWLKQFRAVDAPHYTMSIILDRGLDAVAIRYLRDHHDPASIVFVDGWTGKGSISAELARSIAALGDVGRGIRPDLAVLADPAGTARYRGTGDDLLVPSACLGATVSGLVSRTTYSRELIQDGQFHGAKFYRELVAEDRSAEFVDVVSAEFRDRRGPGGVPPRVDMEREIERIVAVHHVGRSHIKPGVCEATRVMLRRVPRALVVRDPTLPDVQHVLELARRRNVQIVVDSGLQLAAAGLIERAEAL